MTTNLQRPPNSVLEGGSSLTWPNTTESTWVSVQMAAEVNSAFSQESNLFHWCHEMCRWWRLEKSSRAGQDLDVAICELYSDAVAPFAAARAPENHASPSNSIGSMLILTGFGSGKSSGTKRESSGW